MSVSPDQLMTSKGGQFRSTNNGLSRSTEHTGQLFKTSAINKPRFHITDFSKTPVPSLLQKIQQVHQSLVQKKPQVVIRENSKEKITTMGRSLFNPNKLLRQGRAGPQARTSEQRQPKLTQAISEFGNSEFQLKSMRTEIPHQRASPRKNSRLEVEFSKTYENLAGRGSSLATNPKKPTPNRKSGLTGREQLFMRSSLSKPIWTNKSKGVEASLNNSAEQRQLEHTVGPTNTYEFEINHSRLHNKHLVYRKENKRLIQSVRNEIESQNEQNFYGTGSRVLESHQMELVRAESSQKSQKGTAFTYLDWSTAKKYPDKQLDTIVSSSKMLASKSGNQLSLNSVTDVGTAAAGGGPNAVKQQVLSSSMKDVVHTPETTMVEQAQVVEQRVKAKSREREAQPKLHSKTRVLMYSLKYEPTENTQVGDSAKKKGILGNITSGVSALLAGFGMPQVQEPETGQEFGDVPKLQAIVDSITGKDLPTVVCVLRKEMPYFLREFTAAQVSLDRKLRLQESRAVLARKLSQESRAEILKRMLDHSKPSPLVDNDGENLSSTFRASESPKHIRQDVPLREYQDMVQREMFEKFMDVLQQQSAFSPLNSEELSRKKIALRHWQAMLAHSKYKLNFDASEDYRQRPVLFLDLDETLVSTVTSKRRKPGFSLFKFQGAESIYVGFVDNLLDTSASPTTPSTFPRLGLEALPHRIVHCMFSRLRQSSPESDRPRSQNLQRCFDRRSLHHSQKRCKLDDDNRP